MNGTAAIRSEKRRRALRELASWTGTLLLAVVIALPVRAFAFEMIRVDGRSMQDTLQDGEIMLVTKFDYLWGEPERFDVVVCRYPNRKENFVKRVVGLPGDTVSISDGLLTVNGTTYPEAYITRRPNYALAETRVPEGEYFVLGDNRANSNDSHIIGTLRRDQIRGRVRAILFPFDGIRGVE